MRLLDVQGPPPIWLVAKGQVEAVVYASIVLQYIIESGGVQHVLWLLLPVPFDHYWHSWLYQFPFSVGILVHWS